MACACGHETRTDPPRSAHFETRNHSRIHLGTRIAVMRGMALLAIATLSITAYVFTATLRLEA